MNGKEWHNLGDSFVSDLNQLLQLPPEEVQSLFAKAKNNLPLDLQHSAANKRLEHLVRFIVRKIKQDPDTCSLTVRTLSEFIRDNCGADFENSLQFLGDLLVPSESELGDSVFRIGGPNFVEIRHSLDLKAVYKIANDTEIIGFRPSISINILTDKHIDGDAYELETQSIQLSVEQFNELKKSLSDMENKITALERVAKEKGLHLL